MELDVSIIIVNYKTSRLINECIKSIIRYSFGFTYEIIIVDNNSENLNDVIECHNEVNIKFIQLDSNLGFGGANNVGAKNSVGRNLFFLNPDTLLISNAIKMLSTYLDNNCEVGACGGNLYDMHNKPTLSFRRILPGVFWEFSELTHLIPEKILYGRSTHFNYSNKVIDVGYITGADLMIPRNLFTRLGGFSDLFFMYFEETDLCLRIKKEHLKIQNIPDARIIHLEGESFDKNKIVNPAKIGRSENGRNVYYKKNFRPLIRILVNIQYSLFLISRFLLSPSRLKRSEYRERLRYLRF